MRNLALILVMAVYCLSSNRSYGQIKQIGTPYLQNYTSEDFKANPYNWAVQQDTQGIMHFGNGDGLLSYDGSSWRFLSLPNKSVVRSIVMDQEGRMYVGGQGEFGYLDPSQRGQLTYISLSSQIKEKNVELADIWDILLVDKKRIFLSNPSLVIHEDDVFTIIKPKRGIFSRAFRVGENIYVINSETGIHQLIQDKLFPFPNNALKGKKINVMLPYTDQLTIIGTKKNGLFLMEGDAIYPFPTSSEQLLKKSHILCGVRLSQNYFAFGTVNAGLVIVDKKGDIVQHIDKTKGLSSWTVQGVFEDSFNNLWLTLDNGIAHLEIFSPLTKIGENNGVLGSGFTSISHENIMYLGTNQGVYYQSMKENKTGMFELLKGSEGQVWELNKFNGKLLIGHEKGAYTMVQKQLKPIVDHTGVWLFRQSKSNKNTLHTGLYSGLAEINNKNNQLTLDYVHDGLNEPTRFFAEDSFGHIWTSHPYKGIYKIVLAPDMSTIQEVVFFDENHGLPSNIRNHVFEIQGKPVFTTEGAIHEFNRNTNLFEPSQPWNEALGSDGNVSKLIEGLNGDVWFVKDGALGVIKSSGSKSELVTKPFVKLKGKLITSFEHILAMDERNVLIGMQEGYAHYDPSIYKNYSQEFNTHLRSIELTGRKDSLIFGGYVSKRSEPFSLDESLTFENNSIRFSYSAAFYEQNDKTKYTYRLLGFEEEWSNWTTTTQKEYTNLHEGAYVFEVKAQNIHGIESNTASFSFEIAPPLYRSVWAYLLYVFIVSTLLFTIFGWYKKRKDQQMAHSEQASNHEITTLKNEKLRTEVQHKSQELGSLAIHLSEKNEMMISLNDDLKAALDQISNPPAALKTVLRKMESSISLDKEWQNFEYYFNQVHTDFLTKIKKDYPELSPAQYRMCAYLRMNLSSKEISSLLNISVASVEKSRYRLRKKLSLEREDNLTSFILGM